MFSALYHNYPEKSLLSIVQSWFRGVPFEPVTILVHESDKERSSTAQQVPKAFSLRELLLLMLSGKMLANTTG